MSMELMLTPVSDSEIDALRAMPRQDVAKALFQRRGESHDLHKAWHGIHFLLTGTSWDGDPPLNSLLAGGVMLGRKQRRGDEGQEDEVPEDEEELDDFWGYDPPHALYSAQVREWWEAMKPLDEETLRRRFDPATFTAAKLYGVGKDSPDEAFEWLMAWYNPLRAFVAETVAAGSGLVLLMC